ncbi:YaaA family protein [Cellulomonas triticagri]|uniref:Peroxide stress protein YaaA n=1 Tax=Cellulomonas triticagri TaxID=2483352 RepID=A0A3M2JIF1_9CELL|nr:peroxide stress protein YaaA [Cellulomonas triticagri]RMI13419.1 peroxide stress protein YaaA [Cellulomonas triticagri]
MLILLPPSEGKTAPVRGDALDLASLSSPALSATRERVLDALVATSARPDAVEVLGVGAGIADEVARNVDLRSAPTAQARSVYTGVLYAAAGLDRLTPTGRRRAAESVRVVSGLWGLVGPEDQIPAYRLSMGVDLPGVGPLAAAWREPLAAELDPRAEAGELVVDCRSATYLAAWRPARAAQGSWVQVRVLREVAGKRSVVSHHAKHTRGVLTRHLLARRGKEPATPRDLARVAGELVGTDLLAVELDTTASGAATLSLVVA